MQDVPDQSEISRIEAAGSGSAVCAWQFELLRPWAASVLGTCSSSDLVDGARRALLEAALARSAGNFTAAARLLCVTRQGVQRMIQRYAIGEMPCVASRSTKESSVTRACPQLSVPAAAGTVE